MSDDSSEISRPSFDSARGQSFVGKYVLIGLTYLDNEGNMLEQKELHGSILSADDQYGFAVKLEGRHAGETYRLPPDLRPYHEAPPGEYRLLSTGEVVIDPDLLCYWSVTKDAAS